MNREASNPDRGLSVRTATAADQADIRVLLGQLHAEDLTLSTLPQIRQQSNTFLAGDGDETVGLAVVTLVDYGIEAYGMIEELVVDQARRGDRIGSSLVHRCIEWLSDLGAKVIFVSALVEAEAFYLKLGFQRCTGPWLAITPSTRSVAAGTAPIGPAAARRGSH